MSHWNRSPHWFVLFRAKPLPEPLNLNPVNSVFYHAHFSFHQTDAKWGLIGVGMFAYEERFSMYALEKGEWHCRMKCKIVTEITRVASIQYPKLTVLVSQSLWPSDAIWRHRYMSKLAQIMACCRQSKLAQIMACCLMAPSHYLNQCWLMISEVLWHSPDSNFTENT